MPQIDNVVEVWPSAVIQEFRRDCRIWSSARFNARFGVVYLPIYTYTAETIWKL